MTSKLGPGGSVRFLYNSDEDSNYWKNVSKESEAGTDPAADCPSWLSEGLHRKERGQKLSMH